LGEMLIDVAYVMRRCEEDAQDVAASDTATETDEDNNNQNQELSQYDTLGVAPAMERVTDPEVRLHMLLVHGMLHLVGYDHEEDEEYKLMVTKEEEVLEHLGLPTAKSFHQV